MTLLPARLASFVASTLVASIPAFFSIVISGCSEGDVTPALESAGAAGASGSGGTAGTGASGGTGGSAGTPDPAAARYPDLRTLFDTAITPSCAGNEGTCHNAKSAPDLATFASFAASFGTACQQSVGNPAVIVDECEREGDHLVFADGTDVVVLSVQVDESQPTPPTSAVVNLSAVAGDQGTLKLRRAKLSSADDEQIWTLTGVTFTGTGTSITLSLSAASADEARRWDLRRYPREGIDVIVGDPNGNGTPGASLGWRQAFAGDPTRSYLYQRLLNDDLGTQMPMVTGTWSPLATRALWCFLRSMPLGSKPGESDLDRPIVYDDCPLDPNAPDPSTEGFAAVVAITENKCATGGCHDAVSKQGGLDLTTKHLIANTVNVSSKQVPAKKLITPGSPADSYFFCKIDPTCSDRVGDAMPRGSSGLSTEEIDRVKKWIESGAQE